MLELDYNLHLICTTTTTTTTTTANNNNNFLELWISTGLL